jgi:hypothetical protein
MINESKYPPWPEQYLHVVECRSGEEWIVPLRGNATLDITRQVKRWVKEEFCGELFVDGKLMPRIEGDYYACLMTDGRSPDSAICWDSGGFYLSSEPSLFGRTHK